MTILTMPASFGIALTREGERYCESAKAPQSPASGFRAPRPSSDSGEAARGRPDPRRAARPSPLRIAVARRAHIEAIVEQLLELLDVIDGDADLEPSLGSIERHPSPHVTWSGRDRTGDQTHWSDGPTVDLEHDAGEDVEEAGAVMRGGSEHHA